MLAPSWESGAGALAALLNGSGSTKLRMVDLYTFTLLGGQVLRWTSADVAITVNGQTWQLGPVLRRGGIKLSVGISVDTLSVQVSARQALQVNGVPLMAFITAGGFVNARLDLYRAFFAAGAGAATGTLALFTGRIADQTGGRFEKTLQVKSDTELLDVMIPRDVYQAGCKNTLFDAACGLARATYTFAGTASGASNAARTSFPHAMAQAAGYFDLGVVKFTGGPNAGISRTVRSHTVGQMMTSLAWPFAMTAGDAFTATAGCDHTQATCTTKFSNVVHFRGEPYVPAPQTVL